MPRKKQANNQHGGAMYDRVANYWFPANPIRDGERHAVQRLPTGGWALGNYIGPRTDLISKLKQGVLPISYTDKVAMSHDINYSLAQNHGDIRKADLKMIAKLDQLQKEGKESLFNIYMGKWPMQAKMKLEDWGLVSDKAFTTYGEPNSKEDMDLLLATRAKLEMQGYGKKKKPKAKPKKPKPKKPKPKKK